MRVCLIALLSLGTVAVAQARDIDKVNGSIRTEQGQHYGDLDTVNGSISVERDVVAEDVSTVNGGISLRDGAVVRSAETVNGAITLGAAARVERGLETVNGGIALDKGSEVGDGLETVNGEMKLREARVGGDLHTVNGSIDVGAGSVVHGGIVVEKPSGWIFQGNSKPPRITIGANAVVEGDLRFEREVELDLDPSAKVGKLQGVTPVMLRERAVER